MHLDHRPGLMLAVRSVWTVLRLVISAAIAVGLYYAFQASDDLGAAAAVVALGLGFLAMQIDRRLLNRRRSEPS